MTGAETVAEIGTGVMTGAEIETEVMTEGEETGVTPEITGIVPCTFIIILHVLHLHLNFLIPFSNLL